MLPTSHSHSNPHPRLILASSSPYRKELLSRLRFPFETMVPNIDETAHAHETPPETALRLAKEKAGAIAAQARDALIIGSDQVATLDGEQIGKPGSHDKALAQLQKMRGRSVIFHTALCLWDSKQQEEHEDGAVQPTIQLENITTQVTFRHLSDQELDAYLRIEQPYDCAGSAKNEGLGIALIEKIESTDPTALTGLPLIALTTMLRRAGMSFFNV